ncbi:helix-turn-helix transcriptional regulator [Consotaella salsifontis]|uniref:helix-turn-helix transcriptional regulator n=1 Tax=Consotaella salsifontis TaxID=1365950 RepID=UPI0013F5C71D|nr:helix-turn-helix transcriptional regulator [Consotaella salsifontis]
MLSPPQADDQFAQLVEQACSGNEDPGRQPGFVMAQAAESARLCIVVARLPLDRAASPTTPFDRFGGDPLAVAFITELKGTSIVPRTVLESAFGLSPAEARVAVALAQGQTLGEIAKSSQLSRNTVRNQLAAVFEKTETRRQAELMRLIGKLGQILPIL